MSIGMDAHSSVKAILLASTILCMVTWLPPMYYSLRTFFLESLPCVVSAVVAPKFLFVFSNIIVVFLVSESKFSSPSSIETLNSDDNAAATGGGSVLISSSRQEEEEAMAEEMMEPRIHVQQDDIMHMAVEQEEDTSVVIIEGVSMVQCEEECDELVLDELDEAQEQVEEEEGELELVLGDELSREMEKYCIAEEEELEERDLPPADELNRRVEDFIARFNMERQFEERMLDRVMLACY